MVVKGIVTMVVGWEVVLVFHGGLDLEFVDFGGEMDEDGLTELFAQLFEVSDSEVDVVVLRSAEGTFQSVDVAVFELLGENCPRRNLLLLAPVNEAAVLEGKSLEKFAYQEWKLLASPRVDLVVRSVDEGVLFHRVAMQVAVKVDLALLQ